MADAAARRKLWQPVSGPGAVLADGEIVGTWRARVKGAGLQISVEPFGRVSRRVQEEIEPEANRVALIRGVERSEVTLAISES